MGVINHIIFFYCYILQLFIDVYKILRVYDFDCTLSMFHHFMFSMVHNCHGRGELNTLINSMINAKINAKISNSIIFI